MNRQDYQCSITADITAKQAMEGINHVSQWWSENLVGRSEQLNDDFTVHFDEAFVSFKIVEAIPEKKIVWLVTDCFLHWLEDKKEWKGTKISFELTTENKAATIHFTHIGLVPGLPCYNDCIKGWDQYIKDSLFKLLTEGKGQPQKKAMAVN